jgi:hypothetical protein
MNESFGRNLNLARLGEVCTLKFGKIRQSITRQIYAELQSSELSLSRRKVICCREGKRGTNMLFGELPLDADTGTIGCFRGKVPTL